MFQWTPGLNLSLWQNKQLSCFCPSDWELQMLCLFQQESLRLRPPVVKIIADIRSPLVVFASKWMNWIRAHDREFAQWVDSRKWYGVDIVHNWWACSCSHGKHAWLNQGCGCNQWNYFFRATAILLLTKSLVCSGEVRATLLQYRIDSDLPMMSLFWLASIYFVRNGWWCKPWSIWLREPFTKILFLART